MRRLAIHAFLVALGLMAVGSAARAQGLPGSFVSTYGQALEAMRHTYAQATVRGTAELEIPATGQFINRRFVLRIAGSTSRIDSRVTAQQGMGATVGATDIFMAQPGASMQAFRNAQGELANRPMVDDGYNQASTNIRELCPLGFPYSMGTQGTILQILQAGDVAITSFKHGTYDGQPMIQIQYVQQRDPQGRGGPWQCELLISPAEGYGLRAFKRTAAHAGRQTTISGSLSYQMNIRGVPLLQSLEQVEQVDGQVARRQSLDISQFETEAPKSFHFSADGF